MSFHLTINMFYNMLAIKITFHVGLVWNPCRGNKMSSSYFLDPFIVEFVGEHTTVLDLACGKGKWGFLLKTSYREAEYVVGLDMWKPNLEVAKKHYDGVVLANVTHLPFKDNSLEEGLACEVLEHLSKEDGNKMLNELERVVQKKIIVSTPHQMLEQDEIESNPYEIHKTAWSVGELRKLGYKVYGIQFSLFGRFSPRFLRILLSPLAIAFPRHSYIMIGVKKLRLDEKIQRDY
jgi:SAM-dependent methyltransferase